MTPQRLLSVLFAMCAGSTLQLAWAESTPSTLEAPESDALEQVAAQETGIPLAPGRLRVVKRDADGRPLEWRAFTSEDTSSSEEVDLSIPIDSLGPRIQIAFSEPHLPWDVQGVAISTDTLTSVTAEDKAGVESIALTVNGEAVHNIERWTDGRDDGVYTLVAHARDRLGNRASSPALTVLLDRTAPDLRWERTDLSGGGDSTVFGRRGIKIRIFVRDEGIGVAFLEHAGKRHDAPTLAEGMWLRINADTLDYVVEDRLGNRQARRLDLQADREGPVLVMTQGGRAIPLQNAQASRSEGHIHLEARDDAAGVAKACVETSIWYGQCRPLPLDLEGISTGRYILIFQATDNLGNRSFQRYPLEVLP